MRILAIETSCDETAVAIVDVLGPAVRPRIRVFANVVSSQVKLHAKFGGVVPSLAKREHQKNLVPVLLAALRIAGLRLRRKLAYTSERRYMLMRGDIRRILEREPELLRRVEQRVFPMRPPAIDAIAVTVGPGLAPALWVGVNFARALSLLWGKPLIPVNHLEGHIATNLLQEIRGSSKSKIKDPKQVQNSKTEIKTPFEFRASKFEFPAIALLVSGGHTELVLMEKRFGDYRVIGETRDDAAGEAFDKVAKMMRLGFPGGPIIAKLAERGDAEAFPFPRPMMREQNFDFSFSGLKTAVLYTLQRQRKLSLRMKRDVAASFEQAAVDVLVAKTIRAAKQYRVKTVMIGGGVAANTKLRHDLALAVKKVSPKPFDRSRSNGRTIEPAARLSPIPSVLFPPLSLTGDNALMIALAGYFHRKKKNSWKTLRAEANLRLDARRGRK